MKKVTGLLLTITLLLNLTCISMAASTEKENPYVQQYINEKSATYKSISLESDMSDEYESSIAILEEYYNDDIKVAEIVKEYTKKSDFYIQALSLEKEDKINLMHTIEDIYYNVNDEQQQILKGYLDRYANCSKDDKAISFLKELNPKVEKRMPNSIEDMKKQSQDVLKNNNMYTASSSYSGGDAAEWAYDNYDSYSTDFPAFTKWGSDCTNFVSQAIYHGGKSMEGDWYCYKKNSKYLEPRSAKELNDSWDLADPSPWISVKEFASYWESECDEVFYSKAEYVKNHSQIFKKKLYKGDVVILHDGVAGWITMPKHAMIISGYDNDNDDYLLAGHSNNRQAYELLNAIDDYVTVEFIYIQ